AWHEQALFYRLIQPGKNRWNAAFWCGSPSVVRRAALEDVGGVATETITEDIHTSVRMHARGWKTVYHNETLAYGIAPQTFHAFAVQRLRWAQGTMQLLRSPDNPLIRPGLTLAQRLNYFASMMTYFDSYQKLVYLLAPSIVLTTGLLPLDVPATAYLLNWVPYFGLTLLANVALGRGQFRFLLVEQYNLLKMFVFLWATTVLVWPRRLTFRVTPKRVDTSVSQMERVLLQPQIALLVVIGLSVVLALVNLIWGITTTYSRPDIILAMVGWAVANAGILALGIRAVLQRLHARATYRFPVQVTIGLTDVAGRLVKGKAVDLSPTGVGVCFGEPVTLGKAVSVVIELPSGLIGARGEVRYVAPQPDGNIKVGVRFIALHPADRERLIFFLYVVAPRSLTLAPPAPAPVARVA
ncbi:MAG: PilZ domain-containing protein, partial [Dehalococcoidia bacterium]|nr:PilZ domain-containing protein [Dehalococcoidia bacterium]